MKGGAFAVTLTQRARFLCFEPFLDMSSMTPMLTSLAPQKPRIHLMIQLLSLRNILIPLSIQQLGHRVKHRDWLQTHGTTGELILAIVTTFENFAIISLLLLDQLQFVPNALYGYVDWERSGTDRTASLIFKGQRLEGVRNNLSWRSQILLVSSRVHLLFRLIDKLTLICGSAARSSHPHILSLALHFNK